jgi:hypothetical protein
LTQQIPKAIAEESRAPIIVGITGHRWKFAPDNTYNAWIQQVFDQLLNSYPNTPIVVLSPLAYGADRLVAHIAVKNRNEGKLVSLVCPLPMLKDEYAKDFTEDGSKDEFELLLNSCDAWFELPLVNGNTSEKIANGYKNEATGEEDPEPRAEQYKQVGVYIAQYSHVLLGIWNGNTEEKTGGTYQILKMRHEGTLRDRNPLDENDSGPIYLFRTSRKDEKSPGRIESRREIFPGMGLKEPEPDDENKRKERAESFQRVLKGIESFNFDVRKMRPKTRELIIKNRNELVPNDLFDSLDAFLKRLLLHYAVADTLAIHYQSRFTKTLKGLFIVALIALLFFEIYAHKIPAPWILIGYPAVLGLGFAWFWIAKTEAFQKKYLDYRALAEGLRVQFFWGITGKGDEVVDFYLPKQKSELDWIKFAVRSFNLSYSKDEFEEKLHINSGKDEVRILERLRSFAFDLWIRKQAEYFGKKKWPEFEKQEKKSHFIGKVLIISGMVLAGMLFLAHAICDNAPAAVSAEKGHLFEEIRHVVIILIALALASAAAIGGYTEKAAISALAKRFSWMSRIYKRAEIGLEGHLTNSNLAEAQKLIFELGKVALEENADWLIIRRERELEVPTG